MALKLCFRISQNTPRRVGWIRVSDNILPLTVQHSQKDEGELPLRLSDKHECRWLAHIQKLFQQASFLVLIPCLRNSFAHSNDEMQVTLYFAIHLIAPSSLSKKRNFMARSTIGAQLQSPFLGHDRQLSILHVTLLRSTGTWSA